MCYEFNNKRGHSMEGANPKAVTQVSNCPHPLKLSPPSQIVPTLSNCPNPLKCYLIVPTLSTLLNRHPLFPIDALSNHAKI